MNEHHVNKPDNGETLEQRLVRRTAELTANDPQFRAAVPLASVNAAKTRPGLRLAQIMATVMEGYADRPALGERVREPTVDPVSGRKSYRLLPAFQTISYRELWARTGALANLWHHDTNLHVGAGDFVCILSFAGTGYVVVDLAAIHTGAVTVPLQTNASTAQLIEMVAEIEPRCMAASVDCLQTAADIILSLQPGKASRPSSLIILDYQSEDDAQREMVDAVRQRLEAASCGELLHTLEDHCAQGAALPAAPLYVPQTGDEPLSTIYYTSGSTGSPKGAMYPERMVKTPWLGVFSTPRICLHYMPMNHSFGRSILFMILGSGGTCYFTAKNDLSMLFEDIRLVRPTQMGLVPRICEMIFHYYQGEMERQRPTHADLAALEQSVITGIRQNELGGRILESTFGSAPLAPELKSFIETCLDLKLSDGYGTTETAAIAVNGRILRPPIIDYKLADVPELGYFNTDQPHPRGELCVKTANLMLGYFKRPELSAAMLDADGYYKTGDVMAEIGPDQIVYLDRRNNVLKLSQGEFVAIARLEAIFSSGHALIRQCYLYGSSERAFLLAVIVPDSAMLAESGLAGDATAIKTALRAAIKDIAQAEQLHSYEVPRDFIAETEAFSVENGLLTGVGKYLRPGLKTRYGERLNQLYADIDANQSSELSALRREGRDRPVLETLARGVQAILGIEHVDLSRTHSFEDLGGDSLSALSFSLLLEGIFELEVPVGVITNPASNLQGLASYIEKARSDARAGIAQRPSAAVIHGPGATEIHARDLTLDKFIDAATLEKAKSLPPPSSAAIKTVLLTGANGYLGRFLCLEWLERLAQVGGKLICITRGEDHAAARQRIADVFDSGDANLLQHFNQLADAHLEVVAGDLGEMKLGLTEADWLRLTETVDLIVHPAALVNHVLPYGQLFGPNVVGTAELIRLALTTRLKPFINVSTVAAAYREDGSAVAEDADVRVATPTRSINSERYASGYANSKWAGEVLLRDAHESFALPVTVFRSDMILAHSQYRGQINVPDMFTRWIYSMVVTGLAPRSFYLSSPDGSDARAHYDGLPVDFTAAAIATLGVHARTDPDYRTYHVLNPHDDGISLDQFVDWIIAAGYPVLRIADYDDWFSRFEAALRALPEKQRQHSSLPLIHQLRRPAPPVPGASVSAEKFHAEVRAHAVGPDRDIPHLSANFIHKYLDDLRHLELIQAPRGDKAI